MVLYFLLLPKFNMFLIVSDGAKISESQPAVNNGWMILGKKDGRKF